MSRYGQPLPPENPYVGELSQEPLSVGVLISRSFEIVKNNFFIFLSLALVITLPVLLLSLSLAQGLGDLSFQKKLVIYQQRAGFANLLTLLLQIPAQSAMMYVCVLSMQGEHPSFGVALSRGMSTVISVIGTVLYLFLIAILPMIALFVLTIFLAAIIGPASLFLVGVGGIVFAVYFLRFMLAIPVAVVEDLGASENLQRSAYLTEGARGTIFWAFFVMGIFLGLIQIVLGAAAGLSQSIEIFVLVSSLASLVATMLTPALTTVAYVMLRRNKDGADLSVIADVFR